MLQLNSMTTKSAQESIASRLKSLFDGRVYYNTLDEDDILNVIPEVASAMCPPDYDPGQFKADLAEKLDPEADENGLVIMECQTEKERWQIRILRDENSILATCAFIGKPQTTKNSVLTKLSDREMEVLDLLANGLSNKEAAAVLYLSPRTVEKHRANIHTKTKTNSLAVLTQMWLAAGNGQKAA